MSRPMSAVKDRPSGLLTTNHNPYKKANVRKNDVAMHLIVYKTENFEIISDVTIAKGYAGILREPRIRKGYEYAYMPCPIYTYDDRGVPYLVNHYDTKDGSENGTEIKR